MVIYIFIWIWVLASDKLIIHTFGKFIIIIAVIVLICLYTTWLVIGYPLDLLKIVMFFGHRLLLKDKKVKKRVSCAAILIFTEKLDPLLKLDLFPRRGISFFIKLNLGSNILILMVVVIFSLAMSFEFFSHSNYFHYVLISSFIVVHYCKTTIIVGFKYITSHVEFLVDLVYHY